MNVASNPNRARSVLSTFSGNLPHFHKADGSGYAFIADKVIDIDALNPQVVTRLHALSFLTYWVIACMYCSLVHSNLTTTLT